MGKRNMRLKHPAVLTVLTLVALGLVACSARVVEQTELSERTEQISPTSNQNKISSQPVEYTITLNGLPIPTYSNALLYRPNQSKTAPNYLPLFPILSAMGFDYQWNQINNTVTIKDGKNAVKLEVNPMGGGFDSCNRYQLPSQGVKILNGEIWIYVSQTLPLPLGIDHIRWNQQEQEWQLYHFQKQSDRETPLEKAAAGLIKDYLAMDSEERSRLFNPNAEINHSSMDSEEPNHSIRDISIESARQLTAADNLDRGVVKIVVRYTTDYDGEPFKGFPQLGYNIPGDTRHEKVFLASAEGGKILIDDVISHRNNRSSTGSPIPLLDEADYIEICKEWQRKSPYASYYDLFLISNDFITPTLTRVNTNNNFHLPELDDEAVLARFSSEVRQSQGWKDFVSLEGSKDPYYRILDAIYDGRALSATLVGNWIIDSVTVTPILIEVELVRDGNNSWKFTRLANVRLYKNSRELELNEPEIYQQLARLYSYNRDLNLHLGGYL